MTVPQYEPRLAEPFALPDGRRLYAAFVRELPGVVGQGDSPQEALDSLRELVAMSVEQRRQSGQAVPEPLPRASVRQVAAQDAGEGVETSGIVAVSVSVLTTDKSAIGGVPTERTGFSSFLHHPKELEHA